MFSKNNKKLLLIVPIIVLVFVLAYWKFGSKLLDINELSKFIKSFGKLAAIIFIFLFNIKTLFVVVPYSIFVLVGGTIFGTLNGILLSTLSLATSASLAFCIARHLGKDKMSRLLKGRFSILNEKTSESGFNIILFMRLSCLFPADAFSYAAGLTQIKYTHFVTATVIGMLPEIISMSMLGDNIKNPLSKEFLFSICLIVLTAALSILIQKIIKVTKNQDVN